MSSSSTSENGNMPSRSEDSKKSSMPIKERGSWRTRGKHVSCQGARKPPMIHSLLPLPLQYISRSCSLPHTHTRTPPQNRPARGETPSIGNTKRRHTSLASLLALSCASEPAGLSQEVGFLVTVFRAISVLSLSLSLFRSPSCRVLLAFNSLTHSHNISSSVWVNGCFPLLVGELFILVT